MASKILATKTLVRAALVALIATVAMPPLPGLAADDDLTTSSIRLAANDGASKFVPLGIGKSVVIDLPRDIKDVLVADPKIANAVVRSARRLYLIGVTVGQTNVFVFDGEGKQLAGLDIAVTRDLNGLRAALKSSLPGAEIRVEGLGESVMLSGTATNQAEAQQAVDLAGKLVGDANKVVNSIVVRGRDQVMLKVTVAEIQRDVIKQLGIDLSGSLNYGAATLNFTSSNPFAASGGALSDTAAVGTWKSVTATLRAMERAGVLRTLAEPNITAISGESATFLAGGEFPIPAGFTCDPTTRQCQVSVEFKKFGVGLNFTPVVLTEGRISLKVMTEVSELSNENALTLTQAVSATSTQSLTIPSIKTRRAETTIEIPSGGSMALAGMIQESTKQQINGVPGLMKLPVLGTLFKSRDYINRQSELVVIVTPYIVQAVARKDLSRPDDGFADPSDPASILLGRLNRIYGVAGKTEPGKTQPPGAYKGQYGFILD
ncbi:MAG: Flp pilus assembly protein secretin CpaC [Xanthobacteraceae bacterium]|nr:Flp pilus assembly protein secretin CpaC [Xanthobacteraceae bacterium]